MPIDVWLRPMMWRHMNRSETSWWIVPSRVDEEVRADAGLLADVRRVRGERAERARERARRGEVLADHLRRRAAGACRGRSGAARSASSGACARSPNGIGFHRIGGRGAACAARAARRRARPRGAPRRAGAPRPRSARPAGSSTTNAPPLRSVAVLPARRGAAVARQPPDRQPRARARSAARARARARRRARRSRTAGAARRSRRADLAAVTRIAYRVSGSLPARGPGQKRPRARARASGAGSCG